MRQGASLLQKESTEDPHDHLRRQRSNGDSLRAASHQFAVSASFGQKQNGEKVDLV